MADEFKPKDMTDPVYLDAVGEAEATIADFSKDSANRDAFYQKVAANGYDNTITDNTDITMQQLEAKHEGLGFDYLVMLRQDVIELYQKYFPNGGGTSPSGSAAAMPKAGTRIQWSFSAKREGAIQELIKIAEKYEYNVDMETIEERAQADASIYVAPPEVQDELIQMYDTKLQSKGHSPEMESKIESAAKEQLNKSMKHLAPILEKYPTARQAMEARYFETFHQQVEKEISKQWEKTRPPEFWAKKDAPVASPDAMAKPVDLKEDLKAVPPMDAA